MFSEWKNEYCEDGKFLSSYFLNSRIKSLLVFYLTKSFQNILEKQSQDTRNIMKEDKWWDGVSSRQKPC